MPVGPTDPPGDERARVAGRGGVDEIGSYIDNENRVAEVSSEARSELAGVNLSVEQVVRGGMPQAFVVECEPAVCHVEVVEVASLAPLRERPELRSEELNRLEGEEVGASAPPVAVSFQPSPIEAVDGGDLVEVDLDLDAPFLPAMIDVSEAFGEPGSGGLRVVGDAILEPATSRSPVRSIRMSLASIERS